MCWLYNAMVGSFQFIHSIYALVVSSTGTCGNRVTLSLFMSCGGMVDNDVIDDDIIAKACDDVDSVDDIVGIPCEDVDKAENCDGVNNKITKRERTVLKFFIPQIRVDEVLGDGPPSGKLQLLAYAY
jgi:hypothetical protein